MIGRVAYLSMHTSPLLQPGRGDAGGMNVYVDELSRTIARRGIEVDVFTRRVDSTALGTVEVTPGYQVHHIEAGPEESISVARLPIFVREFAQGVLDHYRDLALAPDMVHSHYWLSGWAGLIVKRELGVPLANSFHTLGRVKDLTRRHGDPPESLTRLAAEHEVIDGSDCVMASTPREAEDLLAHYGADPARLCTSPPGVDHQVFNPGDQSEARRRLGIDEGPLVLFVGRIQSLKAVDVAIEAFGLLRRRIQGVRLMVVGGPSGPHGDREAEAAHFAAERFEGAVTFVPPVPHHQLADYYRAADVLHVPSRSESFGLVAAEAQSCGLPVVAADVGGLSFVVEDGTSGYLVRGWDPLDHALALEKILGEPETASQLSKGALEWSERFSWEATANRYLELYTGALARARSG